MPLKNEKTPSNFSLKYQRNRDTKTPLFKNMICECQLETNLVSRETELVPEFPLTVICNSPDGIHAN